MFAFYAQYLLLYLAFISLDPPSPPPFIFFLYVSVSIDRWLCNFMHRVTGYLGTAHCYQTNLERTLEIIVVHLIRLHHIHEHGIGVQFSMELQRPVQK